ncbi:hypothetical protein TNCV_4781981 [Trichonephila clavipes]|nr:hypothetical protein TNCV_4781981 [Trichonephila clavipes]
MNRRSPYSKPPDAFKCGERPKKHLLLNASCRLLSMEVGPLCFTKAFGNGPLILNHGQVTWMTPELAPPSPNYHTNGRTFQLSTDLTRIAALHCGCLVVLVVICDPFPEVVERALFQRGTADKLLVYEDEDCNRYDAQWRDGEHLGSPANRLVAGCHRFETSATEDPPYRGRGCTRLKRPTVGVVGKLGEVVPSQVSSSPLDHGSKYKVHCQ